MRVACSRCSAATAKRYSGRRAVTWRQSWHPNAKVDPLNKRCVLCTAWEPQPGSHGLGPPHTPTWALSLGCQLPAKFTRQVRRKTASRDVTLILPPAFFPTTLFESWRRLRFLLLLILPVCAVLSVSVSSFFPFLFSFLFPFSLQSRLLFCIFFVSFAFTGYFIYTFPNSSPASAGSPRRLYPFFPLYATPQYAASCGYKQQTGYSVILLSLLLKPDWFSSLACAFFSQADPTLRRLVIGAATSS